MDTRIISELKGANDALRQQLEDLKKQISPSPQKALTTPSYEQTLWRVVIGGPEFMRLPECIQVKMRTHRIATLWPQIARAVIMCSQYVLNRHLVPRILLPSGQSYITREQLAGENWTAVDTPAPEYDEYIPSGDYYMGEPNVMPLVCPAGGIYLAFPLYDRTEKANRLLVPKKYRKYRLEMRKMAADSMTICLEDLMICRSTKARNYMTPSELHALKIKDDFEAIRNLSYNRESVETMKEIYYKVSLDS